MPSQMPTEVAEKANETVTPWTSLWWAGSVDSTSGLRKRHHPVVSSIGVLDSGSYRCGPPVSE